MVVTNFIRKYAEKCISTKTILVFPNQKPWVNQKVQHLLRTRFQTFRSGNTGSNRRSRYDLNKVIRKAKKHFHSKLEDEKDVQLLWQRFHTKFQVQVHITSKSQLVHQCGITPGPAQWFVRSVWKWNINAPSKMNPQKVSILNSAWAGVLKTCVDKQAGILWTSSISQH